MYTVFAILWAVGVVLYLWLWYRCMVVAHEKNFSIAATIAMGILTTPLITLIALTFFPDPQASGERRLTSDELAAVFEAKAARMEAARERGRTGQV